jgi:hypothetical protein
MKEIVAARIGNIVTNDMSDILQAVKSDIRDIELLDRVRMQMMASFDLGERWKILANSPTLFSIDETGIISWGEKMILS